MAKPKGPSKHERLTEEEYKDAQVRLKAKGIDTNTACELCTEKQFSLVPYLFTPTGLRITERGTAAPMLAGGFSLPSIALICGNCGNTKLINIYVLEVRQQPTARQTASEPETNSDTDADNG
jgi:hypothetical protein